MTNPTPLSACCSAEIYRDNNPEVDENDIWNCCTKCSKQCDLKPTSEAVPIDPCTCEGEHCPDCNGETEALKRNPPSSPDHKDIQELLEELESDTEHDLIDPLAHEDSVQKWQARRMAKLLAYIRSLEHDHRKMRGGVGVGD